MFSREYLCFVEWSCLSILNIRKDLQARLAIICQMKMVPCVERYLLLFEKLGSVSSDWKTWRKVFLVLEDIWRAESADSKVRSWKWNHCCFSTFCNRLPHWFIKGKYSEGWKKEYLNELAKKKRSGEKLLVKSLLCAKKGSHLCWDQL